MNSFPTNQRCACAFPAGFCLSFSLLRPYPSLVVCVLSTLSLFLYCLGGAVLIPVRLACCCSRSCHSSLCGAHRCRKLACGTMNLFFYHSEFNSKPFYGCESFGISFEKGKKPFKLAYKLVISYSISMDL